MDDSKQVFLRKVTEHIQSKEAKKYVSDELDHHVNELSREWKGRGYSEEEAEEKAIGQMGSPAKMGIELNKIHRPRIDWMLIGLLIVAFGFGFLPLLNSPYLQPAKQGVYVTLGSAAAMVIMLFDYRKLKHSGMYFYAAASLFLLILKFIPITSTINGIPYVIYGGLSLGCIVAVPIYLLAFASFFYNKNFKMYHMLPLFLFPAILFLVVPSAPTAFLYGVMVMVIFYFSHFSRNTVFKVWGIGTILLFILIFKVNEWKEKILAYLHPGKFANGEGYLILHLKKLITDAGWLGQSSQPKALIEIGGFQTDFVFVWVTYAYGWLLAIVLVTVLVLVAVRMAVIAQQIGDLFGKLLLIGAITLYSAQLVVNIAVSLGFFPITSMSLPFISYGLAPTVIDSLLIGIGLSVYRRKDMTPRTV